MRIRGKVFKESVTDQAGRVVNSYWVYRVLDLDLPDGRQSLVSGTRLDQLTAFRAAYYSASELSGKRRARFR